MPEKVDDRLGLNLARFAARRQGHSPQVTSCPPFSIPVPTWAEIPSKGLRREGTVQNQPHWCHRAESKPQTPSALTDLPGIAPARSVQGMSESADGWGAPAPPLLCPPRDAHHRLESGSRWRAPTGWQSRCQRAPGNFVGGSQC